MFSTYFYKLRSCYHWFSCQKYFLLCFLITYHAIFRSALHWILSPSEKEKLVMHSIARVKAKYRAHPRIRPTGEVKIHLQSWLQNWGWSSMAHFQSPAVINGSSWPEPTIPLKSTELIYTALWAQRGHQKNPSFIIHHVNNYHWCKYHSTGSCNSFLLRPNKISSYAGLFCWIWHGGRLYGPKNTSHLNFENFNINLIFTSICNIILMKLGKNKGAVLQLI